MKSYQFLLVVLFSWTISSITADVPNVINYHKDLIDIPCANDADCQLKVRNILKICLKNQCTCYSATGQEALCELKTFKSGSFIGGSCPCTIGNSVCDQEKGACICTEEFTESLDKKRCIPKVVRLNGKCENDGQCLLFEANTECDLTEKICVCQHNFTRVDDTCRRGANLGTRCRVDIECLERAPNTICLDHKCICAAGFVARQNQTECLAVTSYGTPCSESGQCQLTLGSGGVCDNGLCVCDAAHQNVTLGHSVICEKRIAVGDTCKDHGQCFHSHLLEQTMECIGGHCQCIEGFSERNGWCEKNNAINVEIVSPILFLICMIVHKILN